MEIRDYAQINGWWDCKWKIKKTTKTKVTATAKVEYKAVKIDEHSKEMTIKQTTVKKNGRWKTTYTVNGKKVSLKKLKKMFI
jgi:chromosome segregation ATPase